MSIAALIDEGIGPSGSVAFLITEGYSSAAPPPVARTLVTEGFGGAISSLIHEGFSAYVNLPEPPLVGKQYKDFTATTDSGYDLAAIDAATRIGDIANLDILDNNGHGVFPNSDGSGYVDAQFDQTRQQFQAQVFHVSGLSFGALSTVTINDHAPILLTPVGPFVVGIGQQISFDFIAGGYVADPDNDPLTISIVSGTLPAGLTLVGSLVSGFTSASYSGTVSFLFTDPYGATLTVAVSFVVQTQITVPNVTDVETYAAAFAQLSALGLIVRAAGSAYSATVPIAWVLSQSIAAGTVVSQGTTIFLMQSLGPVAGLPGFRVMAVTPGTYGGELYQSGDVFDLAMANDYSDSTVNYQAGGGETVYGWMLEVPSTTPLFSAQSVQFPGPLFPVSFAGVRTVQ